jgi:hypothetical protein
MSLIGKEFSFEFQLTNLKEARLLSRLNKINGLDNSEFWFLEEKIYYFDGIYASGFAILKDGRKVSTNYCYPLIGG